MHVILLPCITLKLEFYFSRWSFIRQTSPYREGGLPNYNTRAHRPPKGFVGKCLFLRISCPSHTPNRKFFFPFEGGFDFHFSLTWKKRGLHKKKKTQDFPRKGTQTDTQRQAGQSPKVDGCGGRAGSRWERTDGSKPKTRPEHGTRASFSKEIQTHSEQKQKGATQRCCVFYEWNNVVDVLRCVCVCECGEYQFHGDVSEDCPAVVQLAWSEHLGFGKSCARLMRNAVNWNWYKWLH